MGLGERIRDRLIDSAAAAFFSPKTEVHTTDGDLIGEVVHTNVLKGTATVRSYQTDREVVVPAGKLLEDWT